MVRLAVLSLSLIVIAAAAAQAQDIAGIEDCTKTAGLDKRTGCLQSNVNILQRLITKNALDSQQRLGAATSEAAALRTEIVALKAAVAELRGKIEQLQNAAKQSTDKPNTEAKPAAK